MGTRIERVVLELDDNLTTGMAKAAAATALLKRELGGLDGESVKSARSQKELGTNIERTGRSTKDANSELNSYAGRIRLIAELAAGLGPALIPIAAIGIPAVAGLANELAGVALGAGTAVLAFHGLGEAVTAVNRAALDPTAANLKAAHLALEKLTPAARAFAKEVVALQPTILGLRDAAASGLFPGLSESLDSLTTRSGDVERILHRVGEALGNLAAEGAASLAGHKWDEFFRFIAQEAPVALSNLGHAIGDVVHGLAQLWIAFTPLNQGFARFINDAADGFDRWATGLSRTEGYHEFIAYLAENGPKVADAFVAIGNAVLKIVEAGAPLGGPILESLTAVANAVAAIAGSNAGPTILATVSALSLLSRGQAVFGRVASASWVQAIRGAETYKARVAAVRGPATRGALALTGLAVAGTSVGDGFKFANTASLALTGSLAGPWGAAVGAGVGLMIDLTNSTDDSAAAAVDFTATLNQQNGAITENTRLLAAQTLQQDGAFDSAAQFGISAKLLTSAALGQKDALEQVNGQLAFYLLQTKPGYVAGGNNAFIDPEKLRLARELAATLGLVGGNLKDDQKKTRELGAAMDYGATKADKARAAHQKLRLALKAEKEAAKETAAKFLEFGDNLDKTKVSLDHWIRSMERQARALEEFGINAKKAADKGLRDGLIKQLQEAGPEGALRLKQLADASQREIGKANRAWDSGKRAARDYLDTTAYIKNHPAVVTVNGVPQSISALRRVQSELRAIHDKTIEITTKRVTGGRVLAGADGMTVPGVRQPYGDKVFAHIAPGEEVISNRYGQADQHRALLKAINARRYSDGGTVAATRVNVNVAAAQAPASTGIDYGRMASTLAVFRPAPPLYGDVHVTDGYGGFKRQMERDRAMASLSGVRRG